MNRPWLLTGTMMACAAGSFLMAHGLDIVGVAQLLGFAFSVVVAGYCAIKGLQMSSRWSRVAGGIVMFFLAWTVYMLMIY